MSRIVRTVAVVLAVASLGYVLAIGLFAGCSMSDSGSGTGDKRPTTVTEP